MNTEPLPQKETKPEDNGTQLVEHGWVKMEDPQEAVTPKPEQDEVEQNKEEPVNALENAVEQEQVVMSQLIERVDSLEKVVTAGFERLSQAIANIQGAAKKQETAAANPGEDALNQDQGNSTYNYVSREKVNALVILCEENLGKFVLLLEEEVYKNHRDMDRIVESRCSPECVNFIKECVFKHYKVPEHLRKFMWQAVKECLDKRVMEKRKKA